MSLGLNVQTHFIGDINRSYPRVNWCLTLWWHFYVKSMSFLVKYKWNFIRQRIAVFRKKSQPWAIICRYLFMTYHCCAMDYCLVVPSHCLNWYNQQSSLVTFTSRQSRFQIFRYNLQKLSGENPRHCERVFIPDELSFMYINLMSPLTPCHGTLWASIRVMACCLM